MTPKLRVPSAASRAVVVAVAWWSSSCSPSGFSAQSLLQSVRILASSADEPYARPGDQVHVTVLAYDGRPGDQRQGAPMNLTWLPASGAGQVIPCINPPDDAYYGCFSRFRSTSSALAPAGLQDAGASSASPGGSQDAGADSAVGPASGIAEGCPLDAAACAANLEAGIALPVMATSEFTMPLNVVTSHPPVAGTSPYGLAYLFNVACAGQVQVVAPGPNPQQAPIGCFDDAGNALGSNDYVFGFTRVYSRLAPDGGYYANANPVITGVDLPPCTLAVPGSVPSFVAPPIAALCTPSSCPRVTIGAIVPESSWELNPLNVDSNGNPLHEEIWADYYATFGGFNSQTRLLYDPSTGAVSGSDTEFEPPELGPSDVHDGFIFGVVYDDRGGESWVSIPTHVCSDPADPVCTAPSCSDGG